MKKILALGLLGAVFAGLATAWSLDRWAGTVSQTCIFAVASLWAAHLAFRRDGIRTGFAPIPLIGILSCGALQLAFGWTVYRWQTGEAMLYWFTNLLALMIASSLSRDPAIHRFLVKALFAGGVVLAVVSVTQNFTSDGYVFWLFRSAYREDVWGPFLYHNQYAAFIELLIPIAWAGALASEHGRWPYVVVTAALFACAAASASRAGLMVAIAELFTIPAILLLRRAVPWRRLAKAIPPLLLLAALFAAIVGPEKVWTRFRERDPYADRHQMTVASVAMLCDRPVTGFGLGTWPTVYPKYATSDDGLFANQAHNDWAQIAAEGGIPALLCFAAFFGWTVRAGWRAPWGLGLAFVLLHALVDYPIQRQALGAFYFALAGTLGGADERLRILPAMQRFRTG